MKRTIKIMALALAIAAFAAPALAQSKECNDENKAAWYKTFYDNFRGTAEQQKTAVDAAKTYIAACPDDPNDKQRPYMVNWVGKYDIAARKAELQFATAYGPSGSTRTWGSAAAGRCSSSTRAVPDRAAQRATGAGGRSRSRSGWWFGTQRGPRCRLRRC